MRVEIDLVGIHELQAAVDAAEQAADTLQKAVSGIYKAFENVGTKISQPTDESAD